MIPVPVILQGAKIWPGSQLLLFLTIPTMSHCVEISGNGG